MPSQETQILKAQIVQSIVDSGLLNGKFRIISFTKDAVVVGTLSEPRRVLKISISEIPSW